MEEGKRPGKGQAEVHGNLSALSKKTVTEPR